MWAPYNIIIIIVRARKKLLLSSFRAINPSFIYYKRKYDIKKICIRMCLCWVVVVVHYPYSIWMLIKRHFLKTLTSSPLAYLYAWLSQNTISFLSIETKNINEDDPPLPSLRNNSAHENVVCQCQLRNSKGDSSPFLHFCYSTKQNMTIIIRNGKRKEEKKINILSKTSGESHWLFIYIYIAADASSTFSSHSADWKKCTYAFILSFIIQKS